MKKTTLPFALLLTGFSGSAYADQAPPDEGAPLPTECQTNDDCDAGFSCEVTGGESCACAPEQSCDCPVVEYRSCVPGPCQTDADCGGDLVCITYDVGCATAVPDCAPGSDCGNFAPPPCENETRSVCAPKWVRPCETASDCGDGFKCEETESCTCSGGGASEPADPTDPADPSGVPFVPPEDDCTCEPSGQKACQLVEVACDDDSGCAAGWTCAHYATDLPCTEPASGGGSDGSSGSGSSGDPDAGAPREETPCDAFAPPAEPAQGVCVPPYANAYGGWANDGSGTPREETSNPQDPGTTPTTTDPTPTTDEAVPGSTATGGACSGSGAGSLFGLALGILVIGLARRRTA